MAKERAASVPDRFGSVTKEKTMPKLRCMMLILAICLIAGDLAPVQAAARPAAPADGSVLPFPPVPSACVAGPTLQESKHHRRQQPKHLPAAAPNILIVLLDDVGFGQPEPSAAETQHPHPLPTAPGRNQLQRLSYHRDLLAHPGRPADRAATTSGSVPVPSPSAPWTRTATPAPFPRPPPPSPRSCIITVTRLPPSANGITAPPTRPPPWDPSPLAHRPRLRLFLRFPCRRDLAIRTPAL